MQIAANQNKYVCSFNGFFLGEMGFQVDFFLFCLLSFVFVLLAKAEIVQTLNLSFPLLLYQPSPGFLSDPHVSPMCSLGHILTTACLKLSWKHQHNRPHACLLPVWVPADQQLRKRSAVCALIHAQVRILEQCDHLFVCLLSSPATCKVCEPLYAIITIIWYHLRPPQPPVWAWNPNKGCPSEAVARATCLPDVQGGECLSYLYAREHSACCRVGSPRWLGTRGGLMVGRDHVRAWWSAIAQTWQRNG